MTDVISPSIAIYNFFQKGNNISNICLVTSNFHRFFIFYVSPYFPSVLIALLEIKFLFLKMRSDRCVSRPIR